MNFETRKIRPDKPPKPAPRLSAHQKAQLFTIGGGAAILLLMIFGIISVFKSLDFSGIIFSFGKTLKVDSAGHTNILLAGEGGEGHDGADLTDTLIVASIDYNNKIVTMLSIPRDLYITSERLKSGERINAIYSETKHKFDSAIGMEELKNTVSNLVGFQIDYSVKVDFDGFKKIVDAMGGVDVNVETAIDDPFYPMGETVEYQTFSISAGPHHLDGDTALKYARSRKTTSDFDRARRQQQIIAAIKEKALSLNILTDPSKIKDLYDSVSSSIETDFSINEIIELARVAKDFNKDNIVSRVISDNPEDCGGFLYTPAREFFGGASVLLPAGKNYDAIHEYTDLIFHNAVVANDKSTIQVLNGTKTPNLANEVTDYLGRLCFNINHYGNATDRSLATSTIYYKPGPKETQPPIMDFLLTHFNFKAVSGIPAEYTSTPRTADTTVVIELGTDYLQHRLKDPFADLPLLLAPNTGTQQSTTTQQSSTQPTTSTTQPKTSATTKPTTAQLTPSATTTKKK